MDMTKPPPQPPVNAQPYQKWIMDTFGVALFLLSKIANSLAELVSKTNRVRLSYKGKTIIMVQDIAIGLNLSTRTIKRYRSDEKLKYYLSLDGHTVFTTQEQFDEFIEKNFVHSDDSRATDIKDRIKQNANKGVNSKTK